jgi:putative colanic acid biosysnthesis UDP-glucose lipid carrier transferase
MNTRGLINPQEAELVFLARLIDAACILLAMFIANQIYREPWTTHNSLAVIIAVVVFYLAADATGLYRDERGRPSSTELALIWTCWTVVVTALLFVAFITKTSASYSRVVSLVWFTIAPISFSLWRATFEVVLREFRTRGYDSRKAAVVGVSEAGERLALHFKSRPWLGVQFIGFFDDRDKSRLPAIEPALGSLCGTFEQLVERTRRGDVDLIFIALSLRAEPRIKALLTRLSDTTASVCLVYDFGSFNALTPQWSTLGDMQILSVVENPFMGVNGWIKRLEDVVFGTLILMIITIPMVLIAVIIKFTSKGNVVFRQRRYGLNGTQIEVLKFRTMTTCDDGDVVQQACKNDPRITKFGAFLRRSSLDELPQFFQVITGEMSIVGPRPHAIAHNEYYRPLIHGYMLRHKVKPGITGWAQVNGWRGETDTLEKMKKRVEYDLNYISHWAFTFDLKIILMTVFAANTHKNAW